ncbi:MAG: glycerol-3-phosphate 1-O-acyltransferase, partial [Thermoleophilaceae bacterium]|nr:glycerol-3-phosphate 1-O-acyltransferase [Thermoleophilaceae bacterium]
PERARVVAGEPATIGALRARFTSETTGGDAAAFGEFVSRQAWIACDRAARAIIGDRYKVPRLVAQQLTTSADFRAKVDELAGRLGRPSDEVMDDAERCLAEVATVQSPLASAAYRLALSPMHRNAWTVEVDSGSLERLRELNRTSALVFMPSHRSYVDPLVLGDILHAHDFPPNHLLGGDNMSFFPIGLIARRAGVIFIRRNFGDDQIYKLAIREMLAHIVSKRFNLEWYIEGGRSRTGKLRPPRYGLLSYLVRAIEGGRSDDIQLVPVSFVYDRLQELSAITAEEGGAAKGKEGIGWLIDYIRSQRRNIGTARVTFGEPFSLRAALEEAGDGPARLEKVAFGICEGINRVTPVTGGSLVTFALLGATERALTFEEVERVIAPLLDYAERRGLPGPLEELRYAPALRRALDVLCEAGVATCFDGGSEPVWSIPPGAHHPAAFYRNAAIHWFVNRALVELALVGLGDRPVGGEALDTAWEDALGLRDLIKFEFFFATKARFLEELQEELALLGVEVGEQDPPRADEVLARADELLANRVLRSFLDAQLVVARELAGRDPRTAWDRDGFIKCCLGMGRQQLLQGRIRSPDSVSKELYTAAAQLAANRDLVDPGREELGTRRCAFLAEIESVVERLERIRVLEEASVEEVLRADGHTR